MKSLRIVLAALLLLTCGMGLALAADFTAIKTVYLLPMSGGLDQYLAVQLTKAGLAEVVTDPARADAIFTDRIGANFQSTMDGLYKAKDKKDDQDNFTRPTMQPLSSGRGSIFLVDRKTRGVVWSMYAGRINSQSGEMNHLAQKIVGTLRKAWAGK